MLIFQQQLQSPMARSRQIEDNFSLFLSSILFWYWTYNDETLKIRLETEFAYQNGLSRSEIDLNVRFS